MLKYIYIFLSLLILFNNYYAIYYIIYYLLTENNKEVLIPLKTLPKSKM